MLKVLGVRVPNAFCECDGRERRWHGWMNAGMAEEMAVLCCKVRGLAGRGEVA
jgi:hypothetical protein